MAGHLRALQSFQLTATRSGALGVRYRVLGARDRGRDVGNDAARGEGSDHRDIRLRRNEWFARA